MKLWRLIALVLLSVNQVGVSADEPVLPAEEIAPAERLFEAAMRFELDGDNKYREMTLKAAVCTDRAFRPAHWQLGEVQQDGKWQTVANVTESIPEVLRQYAQRRERALGDPEGEYELANWCGANGLTDRQQFHFARVAVHPQTPDGLRRKAARQSGLRLVNGMALTEEQHEQIQQEQQRRATAAASWRPKVTKWRDAILGPSDRKRKKALAELQAVDSADAIETLEQILSPASETCALTVVEVLAHLPGFEATASLARHAMGAPWQTVTEAASQHLRQRKIHEYVPYLLSILDTPVNLDIQQTVIATRAGLITVQKQVASKEGLDADEQWVNTHIISPTPLTFVYSQARGNSIEPAAPQTPAARIDGMQEAAQQANLAAKNAARLSATVQQNNARVAAVNERAFSILEQTTGQVLARRATDWWNWWHDYNEVSDDEDPYARYERPINIRQTVSSNLPIQVTRRSCFVAGTPVWTDAGVRPIQSVAVGDRVLSQDPDTGELSFRLVTEHTLRPPTRIMRIAVDQEEVIECTKGHPFWLNGTGWRMAKLLVPDERLHSLLGAATITEVTSLDMSDQAHNLVVAGPGTYFVGKRGLLVHDNTYRAPTQAIIPGFVDTTADSRAIASSARDGG